VGEPREGWHRRGGPRVSGPFRVTPRPGGPPPPLPRPGGAAVRGRAPRLDEIAAQAAELRHLARRRGPGGDGLHAETAAKREERAQQHAVAVVPPCRRGQAARSASSRAVRRVPARRSASSRTGVTSTARRTGGPAARRRESSTAAGRASRRAVARRRSASSASHPASASRRRIPKACSGSMPRSWRTAPASHEMRPSASAARIASPLMPSGAARRPEARRTGRRPSRRARSPRWCRGGGRCRASVRRRSRGCGASRAGRPGCARVRQGNSRSQLSPVLHSRSSAGARRARASGSSRARRSRGAGRVPGGTSRMRSASGVSAMSRASAAMMARQSPMRRGAAVIGAAPRNAGAPRGSVRMRGRRRGGEDLWARMRCAWLIGSGASGG